MGCCQGHAKKGTIMMQASSDMLCVYNREETLVIKSSKAPGRSEQIHFKLSDPVLFSSLRVQIASYDLWISKCVLPGLDPRNPTIKECQDYCVFVNDETSTLLGVFDGHGRHGKEVAQLCSTTVENFFPENKELSQNDPKGFLIALTEKCSEELRKNENTIDSKFSGCTAVFVLLSGDSIHSASVGDSRAVLGSSSPPSVMPAPTTQIREEERKLLEKVKRRRQSNPMLEVLSVQISKDQRPEDPEELARITQNGGKVQRITDTSGNQVGPYRVWESDLKAPGLTMSRSIGDKGAASLGIISTPIYTRHKVHPYADFFVVAGTDGIWDAMDNQDVVNYVECYRDKCKRGCSSPPIGDKVTIDNTCIAQLLCEEVRVRWLTIVEEEDVTIDDISCIVLELQPTVLPSSGHAKRPIPNEYDPTRIIVEVPNQQATTSPARDPRRGSIVLSEPKI